MTMIELNALRYFTSAYETGTFSHAARVNGVSQPTVSAAIQRLEDRLGAPLFRRSRAGLAPTPLATALYHDVIDSVSHLATLEARVLQPDQRILRVHCAPDMLMQGIAPSLHSLRRSTPALSFRFTDDPADCDLAYLTEGCAPPTHDFLPLARDPFRLAVARQHPLAGMTTGVTLAEVEGEAFIRRPYCPRADRADLGALHALSSAQAANDQQLLDLIAAGLGIAFVPASHGEMREDIVLLPLRGVDAGERVVGISHRKSAFAARLARQIALRLGPVVTPVHLPDPAPASSA